MTKKELTHEFDKEREIQKAEQEKEAALASLALQRQRNIKWTLAAGLLFLLGLSAFAFTRLREQQRRRSEALRQKIASDLHDEMGSTLSSISILSEAAQKNIPTEDAAKPLSTISERTRQVMDTMSDIVWSVNPKNDEFGSVVMRMREFAAETLEAKNISLQFNSQESLQNLELPMELRKDFYLFFKEAINNAAKYSQAKQVWIDLAQQNNEITLKIKDDGRGFDTTQVKRGILQLDSAINQGTRIQLTFPFT
jgi:signal transduction histidine kinase